MPSRAAKGPQGCGTIQTWIIGTGSGLHQRRRAIPGGIGESCDLAGRREAQVVVDVPLRECPADVGRRLERRAWLGHEMAATSCFRRRAPGTRVTPAGPGRGPSVGPVVAVDVVLVAGAAIVDRAVAGGLGGRRVGVLREVARGWWRSGSRLGPAAPAPRPPHHRGRSARRVVGYRGHGRSRLGGRDIVSAPAASCDGCAAAIIPARTTKATTTDADGREDVLLQPDRAHRPHQGRSAQHQSECGQASGDTIAQLHRLRRLEAVDEGDAIAASRPNHMTNKAPLPSTPQAATRWTADNGPRPPSELEGGSGGQHDSGLRGVAMTPTATAWTARRPARPRRTRGADLSRTSRALLGRRVRRALPGLLCGSWCSPLEPQPTPAPPPGADSGSPRPGTTNLGNKPASSHGVGLVGVAMGPCKVRLLDRTHLDIEGDDGTTQRPPLPSSRPRRQPGRGDQHGGEDRVPDPANTPAVTRPVRSFG